MGQLAHVYVHRSDLAAMAAGERGKARVWSFRRRPCAVLLAQTVYHPRESFDNLTDGELVELVDVYSSRAGRPCAPGSYGSVWRQNRGDKAGNVGVNNILRHRVPGPWMEVFGRTGHLLKPAELWDMKSAYAWAALQGLPDPRHYKPAVLRREWQVALIRVILHDVAAPFPRPLEPGVSWRVMTREEVEAYRADVLEVAFGVTWTRTAGGYYADAFGEMDHLYGTKVGKRIKQAYWGLWSAVSPLVCSVVEAGGHVSAEWELPPRWEDQVRAHIVQSRVRIRLYQAIHACTAPARVYVDSVMAESTPFSPGTEPGDWGHVKSWEDGLILRHAGSYIDARTGEVLKGPKKAPTSVLDSNRRK